MKKEAFLYGENSPGPYNISDQLILIGSDSVFINDSFISKDHYQIDYVAGTIVFNKSIAEKAKILVRYQRIPALNLKKRYFRHIDTLQKDEGEKLASSPSQPPEQQSHRPQRISQAQRAEEDLMVSGSKSIGFSVTSEQGLGIEQATRLNLAGTIAGVNLSAAISDQSSPIPPEGTTKEISELDKIFIRLEQGEWSGVFGDYDLAMDFGSFGTKTSRVIGAQVKGSLLQTNLLGVYARPKGKFQRLLLFGEDGVQGPYQLVNGALQIVPASEIVYLDGEKMTRGFDEDYTIDYALGEITFTNKRIITNQSRIEVAFEYTFDAYDRFTIGLATSYSLSPVTVGFKTLTEADNQNRSFAYDFLKTEQETLTTIGDDTGRAWLDGGRYVGIGQGDYWKVNGHYQYAGPRNGDYSVFFTYVGDSLGDYVYNESCYVYTGPNSGQYVAKRRIILPEKNEIYLGLLGLNTKSSLGELELAFEGSMSRKDYNLFSPISDEDNNGFAYVIQGNYEKSSLGGISYKRKFTPENFSNPNRSEEIDFAHHWGGRKETERLSSDEVIGFIKPNPNFSMRSEIGWLVNHLRDERRRFRTTTRLFWLDYEISKTADILRQNLSAKPRIKSFYPECFLAKEDRRNSRWLTINPGLGFKPSERTSATISIDLTQEEHKDTQLLRFMKESIRRIEKIAIKIAPWHQLVLDGVLGSLTKHYYKITGTDWQQYFADLALNYSLQNRIRSRIDYSLTNKQTRQTQKRYIKVEPGSGDYKRNPETNEFYPDPKGDYKSVIEPTGRMSRYQEQNWQASFDFSIFNPGFFALFNLNQEKTDTAINLKAYNHELRLALARQKNGTLGIWAVYLTNNYNHSLDYRYISSRSEQNQNSLKFQIGISKELNLNSGFEFNLRKRQQIISNRETERKVSLEPFLGYKLDLEITLSQAWRNIRYSNYPDFKLRITDYGLRRRFEFKKNMVMVAGLIFTNRSASIDKLPFEVALNDPLGLTKKINLSLDQMVSKELVFSTGYSFLDRPDRLSEHNLSVNLKAYF